MEFDQVSKIKVKTVIGPTDGNAAGASTVGAIIDTNENERFESLTYVIESGTITTGSFTVTLEESDAVTFGGEETAVAAADVIGTIPTFAVTDDDTITRIGVIAKKRYQRLTLTGTSTPVGDFTVMAILGHPKVAPVAAQTV
jgi:hypothetical protein